MSGTKIHPSRIRIHCYEINAWYSSPYPQGSDLLYQYINSNPFGLEYATLPLLHICESCLMYLSVMEPHKVVSCWNNILNLKWILWFRKNAVQHFHQGMKYTGIHSAIFLFLKLMGMYRKCIVAICACLQSVLLTIKLCKSRVINKIVVDK